MWIAQNGGQLGAGIVGNDLHVDRSRRHVSWDNVSLTIEKRKVNFGNLNVFIRQKITTNCRNKTAKEATTTTAATTTVKSTAGRKNQHIDEITMECIVSPNFACAWAHAQAQSGFQKWKIANSQRDLVSESEGSDMHSHTHTGNGRARWKCKQSAFQQIAWSNAICYLP